MIIGIIGIFLFLWSLALGHNLRTSEKQASSLDRNKHIFAMIDGDILPCVWDTKPPEHVMAENKSQAILVQVKNTDKKKKCSTMLSLHSPGFDTSPPKDSQSITLPPANKGSLSWIMTPRKTGTYEIAVSDIINTQIFGVTVTNVFGLTTAQAKVFSILGSLFGPMLTVPWWIEKWWVRRQKKDNPQSNNEKKDDTNKTIAS